MQLPSSDARIGFLVGLATALSAGAVVIAVRAPGDWTWLAGAVAEGLVTGAILLLLTKRLRGRELEAEREAERTSARIKRQQDAVFTERLLQISARCPSTDDLKRLGPKQIDDFVGPLQRPVASENAWDRYFIQLAGWLRPVLASIEEAVMAAFDQSPDDEVAALDELRREITQIKEVWQRVEDQQEDGSGKLEPTRRVIDAVRDDLATSTIGSSNLRDLVDRLSGESFGIERPARQG